MAAPAVINVSKISASNIQFADVRKNKNGGASVGFKLNNQNVQFRIPQVNFPGGLQVKENPNKDGSVTVSYNLSASLNGGDPYGQALSEDASETAKAYNFFHDLQERIIQTAVERSVQWFGKKRSEDSIRDSFNKFISVSVDKVDGAWVPNGKYPPSLRMKLPVYDGKVAMELIDGEENDVELSPGTLASIFTKGSSAKLVLQGQIYFVGQSFGVTWKPSYGQIFQRKKATARDFFKRDEDDAEDAEESAPIPGGAAAALADDEEEGQLATEEAPAPAAPAPAAEAKAPARRRKVA
jgi:hypothetical protein